MLRIQTARLCLFILLVVSAAAAQSTAQQAAEPEEPDYFFFTGGPYTQVKNSMQVIHAFGYGTRRFTLPGGRQNSDEFLFFLRTEWGFTDRLELDVITPGAGSRERLNGSTVTSDYAFSDTILGLRYRVLQESRAPFTLTMGPQLLLPTGSVRRGTGSGSAGFAWDVAAAKDWGGPVFLVSSLNYSVLPAADDPTPGSSRDFTRHKVGWATAVTLRPLERASRGNHHDLHVFFEGGGAWGHQIEPGVATGSRRGELSWVFAPGVRYGFLTARKTLVEIGVSAPIGLGPNGPKRGIVIQFQFERLFGPRED